MTISTNRESDRFMLRLPDGMRDRLKDEARKKNRSMNAEIVSRLGETLELEDFFSGRHEHSPYEMVDGLGRTSLTEHIIRMGLKNADAVAAPVDQRRSATNSEVAELIIKQQRMIEELLEQVKSQGRVIDQLAPPKGLGKGEE